MGWPHWHYINSAVQNHVKKTDSWSIHSLPHLAAKERKSRSNRTTKCSSWTSSNSPRPTEHHWLGSCGRKTRNRLMHRFSKLKHSNGMGLVSSIVHGRIYQVARWWNQWILARGKVPKNFATRQSSFLTTGFCVKNCRRDVSANNGRPMYGRFDGMFPWFISLTY